VEHGEGNRCGDGRKIGMGRVSLQLGMEYGQGDS